MGEVRGSLMKDERQANLERFNVPWFKKIACVAVGEPTADFKARERAAMLKQKQEAADIKFRAEKLQEKQKLLQEKKRKELEKQRKKAEKERKKKEAEEKKKKEEEAKA